MRSNTNRNSTGKNTKNNSNTNNSSNKSKWSMMEDEYDLYPVSRRITFDNKGSLVIK